MVKFNHAKTFFFDKARYLAGDSNGTQFILDINYRDNKFRLHRKSGVNLRLEQELSDFARDLLKRKHKVNFAKQY